MSENVRKLIGVAVMAAIVVIGVVATNGDDSDFSRTRNAAFMKLDGVRELPEAEQARLAPAFLERAAPKAGSAYELKDVIITSLNEPKPDKVGITRGIGVNGLSTGKPSVVEGRGVDGKGGASSFFSRGLHNNGAISGGTGKAGPNIWTTGGASTLMPKRVLDVREGNGIKGLADRIEKWSSGGTDSIAEAVCKGKVHSLKNVMVTSYTDSGRVTYYANDGAGGCPDGYTWKVEEGEALKVFPKVEMREAELLAECMDSKVGDVFLKSHIESSATDCIATVLPTALPDRAKQLGTYWQTSEQLARIGSEHCWPCE